MTAARLAITDRPADLAMQQVEPPDLPPGPRRGAVHHRQVAPEGALQAPPRIGPEIAVLVDALGNERVGDLEQERPRTRGKEQERLAVEPPCLAVGPVQAGVVGGRGRGVEA